jgi:hypothetical protein
MAVVAHVVLHGVTEDDNDRVREAVGWLEESSVGGLSHLTWWEGDACHNVDARESEEAFNEFGQQRVGPGMAKVGIQSEPQVAFHPAHEVCAPQPVTITA